MILIIFIIFYLLQVYNEDDIKKVLNINKNNIKFYDIVIPKYLLLYKKLFINIFVKELTIILFYNKKNRIKQKMQKILKNKVYFYYFYYKIYLLTINNY